jgi:hypothetical protein
MDSPCTAFITTLLQATLRSKRIFSFDIWKEEDPNSKFPLLHPGKNMGRQELEEEAVVVTG